MDRLVRCRLLTQDILVRPTDRSRPSRGPSSRCPRGVVSAQLWCPNHRNVGIHLLGPYLAPAHPRLDRGPRHHQRCGEAPRRGVDADRLYRQLVTWRGGTLVRHAAAPLNRPQGVPVVAPRRSVLPVSVRRHGRAVGSRSCCRYHAARPESVELGHRGNRSEKLLQEAVHALCVRLSVLDAGLLTGLGRRWPVVTPVTADHRYLDALPAEGVCGDLDGELVDDPRYDPRRHRR